MGGNKRKLSSHKTTELAPTIVPYKSKVENVIHGKFIKTMGKRSESEVSV